jgi:hypothetical protein
MMSMPKGFPSVSPDDAAADGAIWIVEDRTNRFCGSMSHRQALSTNCPAMPGQA